jgi:hypothetical protein
MAALYHICRRARREDIRRARPLWEPDRVLYDADVWCNLPALLEDLWDRDLVSFAIIESVPSLVPRLFGGISFVRAESVMQARASSSTLPSFILSAAMRGDKPLLTPREVANENVQGTLNLMNFLGNIGVIDLTDPELANFYATSNEGYMFLHSGYSYSAMWHEVWHADHVAELQTQGLKIERTIPLSNGEVSTLMSITAKDAVANPYARFSSLFFPPKPVFGFTAGEQRLIELALLESSDEQAAKEIHLSEDGVKKRWRSIYRKVEMVSPELVDGAGSGAVRRKTLLHYLRRHLEELRPYRE